jgi:O-antigen ligase
VLDQQLSGGGVAHAHNAVLEATLGLGVVGGSLAVLLLLSFLVCSLRLFRWGDRSSARLRGVEFVALFPPVFANSMLDSSFAIEVSPFIILFVAILIDLTHCEVRLRYVGQLSDEQDSSALYPRAALGDKS